LGLRPQIAPHTLLQAHSKLRAFLTLTSTCSLQVNRESSTTPRYLTDPEKLNLTPKNCGSKKPWSSLFLVNASPVLSGLTNSPTSLHRVSTFERAHCMSPDTVFGNLPTARRHMSSAYPWIDTPFPLSLATKSSTTRHHRNNNNTPLCRQPLDIASHTENPPRPARAMQPSRVALIHCTMV
jgi:hypothetical protein